MFRLVIATLLSGLISMPCSAEFRDPTQPAYPLPPSEDAAAGSDNTEFVLSAIWISSQSRRATINGIIVKRGQTIEIEPASSFNSRPTNPDTSVDKENNPNTGTNRPAQKNSAALLPNVATGNKNIVRPQEQSAMNTAADTRQQANTAKHSVRTIKIIDIHKNSVTIDQDGERKTLQLVQRPYKTQ